MNMNTYTEEKEQKEETRLNNVKERINQVKYYVHDPLRPLNDTFTTANLKGKVAHNIRVGDINKRLIVGEPMKLSNNPKKVKVVKPCAKSKDGKTRCTSCGEIQKRLRASAAANDTKITLFDPILKPEDRVACIKSHGINNTAAIQLCMMEAACKRRGLKERGVLNNQQNSQAYKTSMEPWRGGQGLVRAGTATFCCQRNMLKAIKIAALEAKILKAAGAKPAEEQVKDLAVMKEVQPTQAMLAKEEKKEAIFIHQVAPLAIAAEQNEADKVVLGVAMGTINYLRIESKKRLEAVVNMIEGLDYTPSKANKIATAFAVGGAAGGGAHAAGGGTTATLLSGIGGAIYGYARGSTGVIKDIIESIKFANDKIMAFINYVLSDPKRSAFVLEAFVMLKKALCGAISRAIFKEPMKVQQSMFAAAANGAKILTETGTFVVKRLFVESLDKIFDSNIVTSMVGKITTLTGLTMGPLGAAGGFLAEVVGNAASEVMQVYAKQAMMTHYFQSNGKALNALIFGSCIEQPVEKVVTTEATLSAVADTMESIKKSYFGRVLYSNPVSDIAST